MYKCYDVSLLLCENREYNIWLNRNYIHSFNSANIKRLKDWVLGKTFVCGLVHLNYQIINAYATVKIFWLNYMNQSGCSFSVNSSVRRAGQPLGYNITALT